MGRLQYEGHDRARSSRYITWLDLHITWLDDYSRIWLALHTCRVEHTNKYTWTTVPCQSMATIATASDRSVFVKDQLSRAEKYAKRNLSANMPSPGAAGPEATSKYYILRTSYYSKYQCTYYMFCPGTNSLSRPGLGGNVTSSKHPPLPSHPKNILSPPKNILRPNLQGTRIYRSTPAGTSAGKHMRHPAPIEARISIILRYWSS